MLQPVASRQSFELLVNLTEEGPNQSVSSDNFHGLINILDEFASAAGRAVEAVGNTERRKGPEAPQSVPPLLYLFLTSPELYLSETNMFREGKRASN